MILDCFYVGYPGSSGGADPAVFQGPQGQNSWGHGWVMRLSETGSKAFSWRMAVTGGEPWSGGLGFANPDNLAIDAGGNLWVVTDRSVNSSFSVVFGINSCWLVPRDGSAARCFATGPMECELTGVCLDQPETSLFLAVQHPGEVHGVRRSGDVDVQMHELVDRDGTTFGKRGRFREGRTACAGPGRPPRPGVVAIRRWVVSRWPGPWAWGDAGRSAMASWFDVVGVATEARGWVFVGASTHQDRRSIAVVLDELQNKSPILLI